MARAARALSTKPGLTLMTSEHAGEKRADAGSADRNGLKSATKPFQSTRCIDRATVSDSDFKQREDMGPHSRGMRCPRLAELFTLASEQRAQGKPGARCTRGLACKMCTRTRTRAYRFSGEHPAFPAQWFYGLLRALPGERLSCHRHPQKLASANLTPAPRRQNHTTSPSASAAFALRNSRVHRIPPQRS
jgi:hypothetical protein